MAVLWPGFPLLLSSRILSVGELEWVVFLARVYTHIYIWLMSTHMSMHMDMRIHIEAMDKLRWIRCFNNTLTSTPRCYSSLACCVVENSK